MKISQILLGTCLIVGFGIITPAVTVQAQSDSSNLTPSTSVPSLFNLSEVKITFNLEAGKPTSSGKYFVVRYMIQDEVLGLVPINMKLRIADRGASALPKQLSIDLRTVKEWFAFSRDGGPTRVDKDLRSAYTSAVAGACRDVAIFGAVHLPSGVLLAVELGKEPSSLHGGTLANSAHAKALDVKEPTQKEQDCTIKTWLVDDKCEGMVWGDDDCAGSCTVAWRCTYPDGHSNSGVFDSTCNFVDAPHNPFNWCVCQR